MEFKHLQEMLGLNEADNIVISNFKKGWNDSKAAHGKLQKAIDAKGKEVPDDEPTTDEPDPATPPKEPAQQKPVKFNPQDITDDLTEYLDQFFTKFPNFGEGGAEDILQKHPEKQARDLAVNAFRTLATRIDQLRVGFNKSLVSSGLVQLDQAVKFNQNAKKMMAADAPSPPQSLVKFVKKEARFFKRLVKLKDNAQLDDSDFKQLLALKIKQTETSRVPDAAMALNLLFGYMASEFKAHAKVIETAAAKGDAEDRKARIAARQK